jgi:hypothetical protein
MQESDDLGPELCPGVLLGTPYASGMSCHHSTEAADYTLAGLHREICHFV